MTVLVPVAIAEGGVGETMQNRLNLIFLVVPNRRDIIAIFS